MGDRSQQNILIPELNIMSNDIELRNLQRKMLANHYSHQIKSPHHKSQPKLNPERQNPHHYRQLNQMYIDYQRGIKTELAHTYEEEIQMKKKQKREEKARQLREQQQKIMRARQLHMEEIQKNRMLHEAHRLEAMDVIAQKKKQKLDEKERYQEEKRVYRQRYNSNEVHLRKQKSFDEHFHKVNGIQSEIERNYLRNVAPKNKKIVEEKQKIVDHGIQENEFLLRKMAEKHYSDTKRYRDQLRDALQQQIKQKNQKKKKEVQDFKHETYTSSNYSQKYHPINNPVDFRITHDNRYVIGELRSQFENENLSGLARSGSHAVIS